MLRTLKKMPKTAVILAAYNGERYIEEQVQSILNQTGVNISIFISVDLSSDGSEKICLDLQKRYTQINVLPVNKKSANATSNFFHLIQYIDVINFDYVALADQDDIWNITKLESAISQLNDNNCSGYSSNVTAFWPDGRKLFVKKSYPQVKWDFLFESSGPGCTFVLNNKLAIDLQNFLNNNKKSVPAIFAHDWFIYAYARSNGYKWFIDKKSSMFYRQHINNVAGVNRGAKSFIHRIKVVLSGTAMEQASLIATLCGLEDDPFVRKWHQRSRLGMLYLAINAKKCRRKPIDRVYFIFACLLLLIIRKKI